MRDAVGVCPLAGVGPVAVGCEGSVGGRGREAGGRKRHRQVWWWWWWLVMSWRRW